ncbi:EcsC family protein [Streptomyces sp. BA2]|uniref:EcsC family protein n=1 Tax=Streptomyces sp. BA2 TaxID=436595 RepID=UPI001F2060D3|nr:EcsC family protein [Streptomyces sp. BA2]
MQGPDLFAGAAPAVREGVGFRLTKKGLDKAVPAVGIVVGGTLNWSTLEGIVDAAEMAYRRRFLLEKYPHLADEEAPGSFPNTSPDGPDDADEEISLLDEIAEAGGPDLH